MMRCIPILLSLLLPTGSATAQVNVTLPLAGYFRPGKYMPVFVHVSEGHGINEDIVLRGEGAVPTALPVTAATGQGIVAPWLPVQASAQGPTWSDAQPPPPLIALEPDQRLVAAMDQASVDFVRRLFSGMQTVSLINPPHLLKGPTAAWETLDAVVLNVMPPDDQVATLFAAGVVIVVRDSATPRDNWPWELIEGYWVLRREPVGPTGVVAPQAYTPSQMWDPGQPPGVRRTVMLGGAAFSLLVLGATLWRSKWAAVAVVGLSVLASGGIMAWRRAQSPVMEANAGVLVVNDVLTQRDDWIYRRHLQASDGTIADAGFFRPVFASPRQIERTQIRLEAGRADGLLHFSYRLEPNWTLAFQTRRLAPGRWPGEPTVPATTPMREIAPLYLSPGYEITGELEDPLPGNEPPPPGVKRWKAVVIEGEQG